VARANTNAQWAAALPVIQEHLGEIERCVSQKFPPEWKRAEDKIFFLIKGQVEMEKLFQRQFNRTDYFPLPGGHPVAAFLHLAAAICWRAERACVAILPPNDPNREAILVYLNRLHHVLQLLARRANRTYGTVDPIAGA
jgi:ATP:cob(I)alamin adenosyltransferase